MTFYVNGITVSLLCVSMNISVFRYRYVFSVCTITERAFTYLNL